MIDDYPFCKRGLQAARAACPQIDFRSNGFRVAPAPA